MIGMGSQWVKREIAERLIRAAGDLVDELAEDEDIGDANARECLARWLKDLPGRAWDDRLGPRPK